MNYDEPFVVLVVSVVSVVNCRQRCQLTGPEARDSTASRRKSDQVDDALVEGEGGTGERGRFEADVASETDGVADLER